MRLENKTILILSPEDWGTSLLSKHLYAKELSKSNKVFFIHTAPHSEQASFISSEVVSENLKVIRLKKVVKGIFKLPKVAIDIQNKSIVKKVLKYINEPIDVVWSFDQSKFQDLNQFEAKFNLFHPVDLIDKAKPFLTRISNTAHLVLSVSEKILDEIETTTPKHFINHGLDELFLIKKNDQTPPPYFSNNKVNMGYVGNLQMPLIHWDALIKTVEHNQNVHFVFIGPDGKSNLGGQKRFEGLDKIKALDNTHFTGAIAKEELASILPHFDGFVMSYDHIKYPIKVSNSHKIIEYLSTGKVIVSNFTFTYANENLFEMVDNVLDLPSKVKQVVEQLNEFNQPQLVQKRIAFAKDNTYANQIKRIEKLLN